MTSLLLLLSLVCVCAASWYMTRAVLRFARQQSLYDLPNSRSSHLAPTPRAGGCSIVVVLLLAASVLGGLQLLTPWEMLGLLAGAAIAVVGVWDDYASLPVRVRLPVQATVVAGAIFCFGVERHLEGLSGAPVPAWMATVAIWLALIWLINLTNFMDGIDGLAGAEAGTIASLCCCLSLAAHGFNVVAVLYAVLAAAVGGFLLWNWYPAKIFMGDVGSTFLGYCFGALILLAISRHALSPFVPVILLGVFIVDASFTLCKRMARREPWYTPHRSHAFQHLAQRYGHERTTLAVIAVNLLWLAPWAALAQRHPAWAVPSLLIAWTPLIVGAQLLRAGEKTGLWSHADPALASAETKGRLLGTATLARTGASTVMRLYRFMEMHGFVVKHVVLLLLNFGCVYLAFLTRFDGMLDRLPAKVLPVTALIWCAFQGSVLLFFRASRSHWRFTSFEEVPWLSFLAIFASTVGAAMVALVSHVSHLGFPVSRSVYVLDAVYSTALLLGLRVASRTLFGQARLWTLQNKRTRVLIYGADASGVSILSELRRHCHEYRAVGFLDDRAEVKAASLSGLRVLGGEADLARLAKRFRIDQVIIASQPSSREKERSLGQICVAEKLELRSLRTISEEITATRAGSAREVAIEDLLGRKPVQLDTTLIAEGLQGEVVMVTGAAGSIGSELCRQIARFRPRAIIGYEINETALFYMERQMQEAFPDVSFVPCIGSVQNRARLNEVFFTYRPRRVYHAAAYKHVPLMEQHIFEAIENNIFGTETLLQACEDHEVRTMVMISTDKAARPTSLMGVSKRVAEMLVRASSSPHLTCVSTRFGNVLGSNGSVVPIFREQIAKGGPVRITHPAMVRFFMTIPEAAQLVLQAASLGSANEIFVLDMGAPVKIVDLAERMIRLAGLVPGRDIALEFTGMRPGEKLYEELSTFGEELKPTAHSNISVFRSMTANPHCDLRSELDELRSALDRRSVADALRILERLVPDYTASREIHLSSVHRPQQLEGSLHVA